ncbi:hypothetical protein DFH09DRAFT_1354932 [Mycena vulgaris]|nr:hypothetical protein DFH09DRAFT_1354932 [Mycena vulgaris]
MSSLGPGQTAAAVYYALSRRHVRLRVPWTALIFVINSRKEDEPSNDMIDCHCIQPAVSVLCLPPLPPTPYSKMVQTPFIYVLLASFCAWGRAALVNATIEDFSPLLNSTCRATHCDAGPGNSNPCGLDGGVNRTWALILPRTPCQMTIPFSGTAVYAFLACRSSGCQFEIDDTAVYPNIRPATTFTDTGLSYFNTSLPHGPHTLVITVSDDLMFDSVMYTFDDGTAPKTTPTTSTVFPLSTSSKSVRPPQASPPVGGIVGGVFGGLALLALLAALIVIFKRRSRRRTNTRGRISLADTSPPADVEAGPTLVEISSPSHAQDNTALAEQIRVLQAQTAELQLAL